jgi:Ulp1 family protease
LENAKGNILSKLPPLVSPLTDDGGEQEMAIGTHVPPTEEDEPMLAMGQLAISDEKEGDLGDHGADKQLHADQQHEDRRRERERIEEQKRIAAEQKRLRETGGLRAPRHRLVTELSGDWKRQIKSTLSRGNDIIIQTKSGNGLKAHDFEKVILPQAWLNDEIVNGSLEWLDDHVNTTAHRKCLSFSSFLWPRIKSGQSTDRLLRRLGISNAEIFLALETVLIPICAGNHWTLVVVRPKGHTVAHMDSMNPGGSPSVLKTAREWVKRVCGDKFVETQWSIAKYQAPLQINGNDCGAHVITNGVCIAKGVNPAEAYKATDMPLQRLRIAGMLLNRGFSGDFGLGNF